MQRLAKFSRVNANFFFFSPDLCPGRSGRVTCVEGMFLISVTHCQVSALGWKA